MIHVEAIVSLQQDALLTHSRLALEVDSKAGRKPGLSLPRKQLSIPLCGKRRIVALLLLIIAIKRAIHHIRLLEGTE